MTMVSSFH